MKLTKEQFITAVETFEEMCKQEDEIVCAMDITAEWRPGGWISNYYNLLTELCELPENDLYGTDLDYFCYELNFGKNWKPGMITNDCKDVPCRNAEELWNMIMEEESD